ncbi:hypothetical protein GJ496_010590 [Pomphorhynchus laevis]|nr:hypothetical protein GJ496_010590 [Pomphorhynchus laevis]
MIYLLAHFMELCKDIFTKLLKYNFLLYFYPRALKVKSFDEDKVAKSQQTQQQKDLAQKQTRERLLNTKLSYNHDKNAENLNKLYAVNDEICRLKRECELIRNAQFELQQINEHFRQEWYTQIEYIRYMEDVVSNWRIRYKGLAEEYLDDVQFYADGKVCNNRESMCK